MHSRQMQGMQRRGLIEIDHGVVALGEDGGDVIAPVLDLRMVNDADGAMTAGREKRQLVVQSIRNGQCVRRVMARMRTTCREDETRVQW